MGSMTFCLFAPVIGMLLLSLAMMGFMTIMARGVWSDPDVPFAVLELFGELMEVVAVGLLALSLLAFLVIRARLIRADGGAGTKRMWILLFVSVGMNLLTTHGIYFAIIPSLLIWRDRRIWKQIFAR